MLISLTVFLVNNEGCFCYYKQDQTRNPKTCYAFVFQAFIEFIGCFSDRTRPYGVFRHNKGFLKQRKHIKFKLQKLKGKIKYNALKVKVVQQILYIHSL